MVASHREGAGHQEGAGHGSHEDHKAKKQNAKRAKDTGNDVDDDKATKKHRNHNTTEAAANALLAWSRRLCWPGAR